MKNILIYITGFLAIILIVFISCNESENLIKKNENVKMNFEGFTPDSTYNFRSKAPETYGDSTFLIHLRYNSNHKVTRVAVEIVASDSIDKMITIIFINDTVYSSSDSVWFEWSSGCEDIWRLKLGENQLLMVNNPDESSNCSLICTCAGYGYCRVMEDVDENCNYAIDCWCDNGMIPPCDCECDGTVNNGGIPDFSGPGIIIQADILEYLGHVYD